MEVPWPVTAWREVVRQSEAMPPGDDQDWQGVCRPLVPERVVLPAFTPPPLPAELGSRPGAVIDGERVVIVGRP